MNPVPCSRGNGAARRGAAPWATNALALAASPVFAAMGALTAIDAQAMALCASTPGFLPIDRMTAMYLLMSLFHLPPWLKLARRP